MTRVFISPDYTRTNPYQRLLAGALNERGVNVELVGIHGPLMPTRAVRERGRPDVIHFHWLHSFLLGQNVGFTLVKTVLFLTQILLLRLLRVHIVWTAHNLTEHDPRHPRIELGVKHLFVRCTDAVIVHCEDVQEQVIDAYRLPDGYRDRLHVIPHGHYCDVYGDDVSRTVARQKLGLDDEFTFLFFGRVCAYKNVTGLIETFTDLEAPDARLVVAGNPENETIRTRVEQAAARDERVETTLEFIPEERVQYYMKAADVVVLPFSEILTSGSTILAMSFGNPVVVPDEGCVSAVVPDAGGFTYGDDGPGSLHSALSMTVTADLEAVGAANRAAVEQLEWDAIARRTSAMYSAG